MSRRESGELLNARHVRELPLSNSPSSHSPYALRGGGGGVRGREVKMATHRGCIYTPGACDVVRMHVRLQLRHYSLAALDDE